MEGQRKSMEKERERGGRRDRWSEGEKEGDRQKANEIAR